MADSRDRSRRRLLLRAPFAPLIVTTYQGPASETLWWQAVPNPVQTQGDVFKAVRDAARRLPGSGAAATGGGAGADARRPWKS